MKLAIDCAGPVQVRESAGSKTPLSELPDRASQMEMSLFPKHDRIETDDLFLSVKGSFPVLLSAPHAVRHTRSGKIKKSDRVTGTLALLLAEATGCSALCLRRNYGGDPNYDEVSPYKQELLEMITELRPRIVIDLHGMATTRLDIDVGTMWGRSLNGRHNLVDRLRSCLAPYGLHKVIENKSFCAAHTHTITRLVSTENHPPVPALQLEISGMYRDLWTRPGEFTKLFRGLADYVEDLRNI